MKRLAIALLVAACTSRGEPGPAPTEPNLFTPEADPGGASVYLRGAGEGSRVRVDVVLRGASDLHGAALRVTFDPEALAFVSAEPAPVWSRKSMSLTKEGTPGQLAVAWFEKGERAISAAEDTVLGTLLFDARPGKTSSVAFRAERSTVVDRHGKALDVHWRGGTIRSR